MEQAWRGLALLAQPARPDRGRRRRGPAPRSATRVARTGTTSSWRATPSTWRPARRSLRASRRSSRATSSCSSWRSCAGRFRGAVRPRLRGRWFRPCSCARRRSTARASCPTPSSRSTAWPTTRCTWRGPAKVALASLHAGRSSTAERCRAYAGFSPCFRREAGAARRDSRGIFRVHQFDKVEMFAFVEPRAAPRSTSGCWRSRRRSSARWRSPTAWSTSRWTTLGASAAKKYDCEAWLPGQGRYRELTSASNTTDFQARRPWTSATARPAAARPACTRSTGPRWRSTRSSPCWRTASAGTGPWRSRGPARLVRPRPSPGRRGAMSESEQTPNLHDRIPTSRRAPPADAADPEIEDADGDRSGRRGSGRAAGDPDRGRAAVDGVGVRLDDRR